jgi:hypothetical protein
MLQQLWICAGAESPLFWRFLDPHTVCVPFPSTAAGLGQGIFASRLGAPLLQSLLAFICITEKEHWGGQLLSGTLTARNRSGWNLLNRLLLL